jgi:hypothetical protein
MTLQLLRVFAPFPLPYDAITAYVDIIGLKSRDRRVTKLNDIYAWGNDCWTMLL